MDTMDIDSPSVSPKTIPEPFHKSHMRSASDPAPSSQEEIAQPIPVYGTPNGKHKGHKAHHSFNNIGELDGAVNGAEIPRPLTSRERRNIARGLNPPNTPNTKKPRKQRDKNNGPTMSGRIEKTSARESKEERKNKTGKEYTRFNAMRDDERDAEEAQFEEETNRFLAGMAQRNETRADRALRRRNGGGIAAGSLAGRLARHIQSNTIEDVASSDMAKEIVGQLARVQVDEMKQYREQNEDDSDDEANGSGRLLPVPGGGGGKKLTKKERRQAKKEVAAEAAALAETMSDFKW